MTLPYEAVEAAAKASYEHGWPDGLWDDCEPEAKAEMYDDMRAGLEAAAPILLSHEIEQTRLAHLDAVVNAETADNLQHVIDAIRAYGRDREKYTDTGSPEADKAIRSYAYHMERIITEALEGP